MLKGKECLCWLYVLPYQWIWLVTKGATRIWEGVPMVWVVFEDAVSPDWVNNTRRNASLCFSSYLFCCSNCPFLRWEVFLQDLEHENLQMQIMYQIKQLMFTFVIRWDFFLHPPPYVEHIRSHGQKLSFYNIKRISHPVNESQARNEHIYKARWESHKS